MKKILKITLSVLLILNLLMIPNYEVQAANVSLSVSASTVNIGDTVKVTVSVPDGTTATVDLNDWSNVFSFSSSSVDVGTNGGTITINVGKMSMANSNSVTITFKANTSGTANIKATVVSAVDNNTVEDVTLGGASTSITVANKTTDTGNSGTTTETQKSADNSLSSLKLSSGTLSPSFKKSTTKYTATVAYDVTKVVVSAKTSNENAVIESVTDNGTVNLKVGENTIQIVVRAENGVKATYTIVVTRKEQESTPVTPPEEDTPPASEDTPPEVNEMLQWNGEQLQPVETIPEESIPVDFESTLLVVNGQQMQGLSFTKGDLNVLYLNNTNGAGSLYVVDEEQQTIYPFIKIISEKGYVLVLLPDVQNAPAPEGFESCALSIEGKGLVNAYQLETLYAEQDKSQDFYLMYCMNNAGEKGWYMYDSVEGTYQRYYTTTSSVQTGGDVTDSDLEGKYVTLEKELNIAKMTQYIILAIAAVVILILIIIIIVLAVKNSKKNKKLSEQAEKIQIEKAEKQRIQETAMAGDVLAIEKALAVEEALAKEEAISEEENDDELEIEFYEMEAPEEAPMEASEEVEKNDDELEIEFYEMEAPVEEPEEIEEQDDELEIEFFEMKQTVENQEEIEAENTEEMVDLENAIVNAIEKAKKEVEPAEEPEIKIVRKPKTAGLTSKLSSQKEADDDDLEFIDFE